MSTIQPTQDHDSDGRNTLESISAREQLLGMLVVILVLLLAIMSKSL